jgi:hypothetical protein
MTPDALRDARRALRDVYGPLSLRRFGEMLGITGPEPGKVARDLLRGHAHIGPDIENRVRALLNKT